MNDCNTTGFIKFTHLLLGKMKNPGIGNDVTFMDEDVLHNDKDRKPKREIQPQIERLNMKNQLLETICKEIISRIDKRHLSAQAQNELVSILSFLSTLESGSSETPKEDTLRYCIEYINPCFPLLDSGNLNVRHLRVPDEDWAEMAITLILSFGGKIYSLYRGNVKDGKLADWPTPMIVESEDWFTDEWLHELMDCGHNCL